jgi:rubrerythrin
MKELNAMLRDEKKAPNDYYHLMAKLPRRNRRTIKGIIADERRHLLQLKQIRRRLKLK